MSNLYAHPSYGPNKKLDSLILNIPAEHIPHFLTILQRALNCWDAAPPEWKHLADMIQHGKPLQDYYRDSQTNPSNNHA